MHYMYTAIHRCTYNTLRGTNGKTPLINFFWVIHLVRCQKSGVKMGCEWYMWVALGELIRKMHLFFYLRARNISKVRFVTGLAIASTAAHRHTDS